MGHIRPEMEVSQVKVEAQLQMYLHICTMGRELCGPGITLVVDPVFLNLLHMYHFEERSSNECG